MAISYGTITITDLGSVTKVDVYYYVSTSATELSGGSWSTNAPAWSENTYIWSKTVTTWEEGRTTESNPACITGAKGSTGTTGQSGRSVQSIKEQYYLSTSSTSQAGGSWQDSMPTYVNGRYYWTHSIITWKEPNGSTTTETTTAVLANALTSANSTAKSASDTATAANNTATAANNTANAANTTAGEAKSIAEQAQSTAGQALTTANNKNKTFYQDSQPTGGSYLDGDSWYDTNDDNKLYIYNGTSNKWVAQQFGNAAIADTSITNAKIADATIQSAKIISLEGAKIVANSITSSKLATDAIKSNNYQASPNTSSPYSAIGTFLDLATGNIYTPNFGVDSVNGAAHINGQIIATSGQIGDSSTNYWQIGTYNDYNMNPSAAIIGHGTSYIQSGTWQISNDRINTQTYDGNNQITYIHSGNKYWDYGMQVPELDTTKSTYINGVSNNWLYIRRSPSNSIPTLQTDWEYLFRVDKDGTVYENGTKLSEKYASIDGVSGAYLPRSGGTITGNLTVNGTLTATASKANELTHTLSINGQSWSGSANLTINTLGVAYGGTGAKTFTSGYALIGNGANAIQTRAIKNNTTNGALGWTSSSASTELVTTNTIAYWNGAYTGTSSNLLYTKWGAMTDIVTKDYEDFITVNGGIIDGSLQVTDLTAGDLIVNGAGRFTNGLYGELTGNASTATKLATGRTIQTNLGSTSTATFDGSANITPGITGTLGVAHGGTGKTTGKDAANYFMNSLDTGSSTPVDADYYISQYVSGGTTTTTYHRRPMSALWSYVQDKINSVLGLSTTGYTGNAATASSATKVGNSIKIQLNSGTTEGTNQFTFDGSAGKSLNITKSSVGLGNVTNNAQVKGLSSGTTSGHLVSWGSDGYTVADSGIVASNVKKTVTSLASNNDGKIVLSYLDGTTSDPIEVKIIGQEGSSVSYADALNVNGTAVGSASQPVFINAQGKPQAANTIPTITLNGTATTSPSFYAPTGAGTNNYVLKSNGSGAPTWLAQSSLSVGSATTATKFSSTRKIELTGDTTGSATTDGSSGWSISTKTDRLTTVGDNRAVATKPNDYANKTIFQGLKTNSYINSPSSDNYSYLVGLRGWSDSSGGNSHELAFNDSGIFRRTGATTDWNAWVKLVDSGNYTDYTVTKTGTGASGTWGINITGNAATSSYPRIVAANEIRFDINTKPSSATTLYVGYKWSDGSADAKISKYVFYNGNAALAEVQASTFYGALSGNASSATKATQDSDGNTINTTYAKLASPTFTGVVTSPHYISSSKMTISSGKVTELTTAPRGGLFADGVAFTNPATRNDMGWVRVLGTAETDTVMEIATGDDGGNGEQIVARQYNTSSAVVHEMKLLDNSGNTSIPGTFTIASGTTLQYDSTLKCLKFIFN